jgi:hypothetical protein
MTKEIISNLVWDLNDGEGYVIEKYLNARTGYKKLKTRNAVQQHQTAFKKLKTGEALEVLKNTMLLTLDDNLPGCYEQRALEVMKIQRDILFYDMMRYRGINVFGSSLVKSQLAFLEEIECYDLIIEILNRRKKHVSVYEGNKAYRNTLSAIKRFERCRNYLNHTIDVFLQCGDLNLPEKALTDPDQFYKSQLQLIYSYYTKTKSKHIHFYLLNIKQIYDYHIAHPRAVLRSSNKVMKLLDAHPKVFGISKVFFALLNLAYAQIKNLELNDAFETLKKTESIESSLVNKHLRSQLYFSIYLYSDGKLVSADELLSNPHANLPSFVNFKTFLLHASLLFIRGEFKELDVQLRSYVFDEEDREGWHFYFKLIHIMVLVELDHHDAAALLIERFRKQIERGKKLSTNYFRWQTIKKMLVNCSTNSFNFKSENLRRTKYLELIKSMDRSYRWIPGEAELIPFHHWYECKIRARSYSHSQAMEEYMRLLESTESTVELSEMDLLIDKLIV